MVWSKRIAEVVHVGELLLFDKLLNLNRLIAIGVAKAWFFIGFNLLGVLLT